ncbi:Xanthine phosphoribosyltransferase [Diplonema papillatum]|nr:Xanthine phosphoribosyltransferase [Diplonema papillatum]|eukprot:gene12022-18569_t
MAGDSAASTLRRTVVDEGELVGGGLVRLTRFLNHQVDPVLLSACASELAARFSGAKATKVLTAPVSGILLAFPLSVCLGVRFVYARTTVPGTLRGAELVSADAPSRTTGVTTTFSVARAVLQPGDRVLIADDFLATGRTGRALAQLVRAAGAEVVGFAAFLSKPAEGGRDLLAGELGPGVPVETLVDINATGTSLDYEAVLLSPCFSHGEANDT